MNVLLELTIVPNCAITPLEAMFALVSWGITSLLTGSHV